MKKTKIQNSITFKLIISTISVLLILIVTMGIIESYILEKGVSEIEELNMERMAYSIKETIELSYESKQTLLGTFATGSGIGYKLFYSEYGDPQNVRRLKSSITNDLEILHIADRNFENIFIVDRRGLVVSSNSSNSILGERVEERDYFKAIIIDRNRDYISSQITISESTGNPVVVIAKALYFNNIPVGLIAVTEDINDLGNSYILNKKIGRTGHAYLFNGSGQLLVHPDKEQRMTDWSSYDFIAEAISQKGDLNIENSYKNVKKWTSISYLQGLDWYIALSMNKQEILEIPNKLIALLLGFLLAIVLSMSAYLILFSRSTIAKPLKSVLEVIEMASGGDLSHRGKLIRNNELGFMTSSFNSMLNTLNDFFHQLQTQMTILEDGGVDLMANMEETSAAVHQIKANIASNLTQIQMQKDSVDGTVSSVEEIARNIENQDRQIGKQGEQIISSSSAIEQMIAQMSSVSESTEKALEYMETLNRSSEEGQNNMNLVAQMLRDIENKSQELEAANTMISSIAAQTNLLAMNAAIEAAHAGDAGRGFAVVADEIRKLAEQSTGQSRQVRTSIAEIKKSIHEVVQSSEVSTRSFVSIVENVLSMDTITREIKMAMSEQVEGSSQVLGSLEEMRGISTEVDRGSKEMTDGNKAILTAVTRLLDITRVVGEAMSEIEHGIDEINNSVLAISTLSEHNRDSISLVRKEADKYRLLNK